MVDNSYSFSRAEHSMMHLVNEASLAGVTTTMIDQHDGDPVRRLKTAMPKKGNVHHHEKMDRHGKFQVSVPIKLYISGRNLKNMDVFSKSDPLCVIFEKAQDSEEWFEIGRTEFIKDSLNPNFERAIDVDYFFEKTQNLRFEFIDDDGGDSDDPYYDIIGAVMMPLSNIMSS